MIARCLALLLAAAVGLPLAWTIAAAARAGLDAGAWTALARHPQTAGALGLSLATGFASFVLALAGSSMLMALTYGSPRWARLQRPLPAMLALPHTAFAVGLLLLIAPSGWLVRAGVAMLSPFNHGLGLALDAPPPWQTSQDPWGLGLIAVLTLKEIPFLLWAALAQLQRPDLAQRLAAEIQLAQTLGYRTRAAWWRIVWPQLLPRLQAPLMAVLAYSLTAVDIALVAGPSAPPTLSVLAWQWLQDPDPARNALGAAAAWLLAAGVGVVALTGWLAQVGGRPWARARWSRGLSQPAAEWGVASSARSVRALARGAAASALPVAYTAVACALVLGSVMGVWRFPALWPQLWSWEAWHSVAGSSTVVWTTLILGFTSSAAALLWSVAWLEWAPSRWQHRFQPLVFFPLMLPGVLWVVGMHALSLAWGLDGQASGLWLAHSLCVLPYVLLSLEGPYGRFDPRLQTVAASLGRSRWAFVVHVKWPLLRAALTASFAVGFAVSVAQYVPTLYIGGGRFSTATTEAVALSAGGQRSLMAAYAALQWLLPALVFGLAAWGGRTRRFTPPTQTRSLQ